MPGHQLALRREPRRGCGGAHAFGPSRLRARRALCDHFRIPVAVLINKADLNHEEVQAITRLADDKGYTVVGALPFDPAVTGAMIRRKALTETDSPLASTLSAIWGRIRELAYAPRKRG